MKLLLLINLIVNISLAFSIGFNYSKKIPKSFFYSYDYIVINPNVKIPKTKAKKIVYISIEENEEKLNKNWIIGYNKKWRSYIYDIRNKEYQNYLFNKIKKYTKKFDGFFFDTLDSYYLTKVNKNEYKNELIKFLTKIKNRYPNKYIIYNRGFELLKYVKPNAIVAENLFFDDKNNKTKKEDQIWLINKLNYAKKLGITPIVIDYITPFNKQKAINLAKKIYKLGFIPYITDLHLTSLGISYTYPINRKILVIYTGNDKTNSVANTNIAMPLEFFGYIPDLKRINEINDLREYDYIIIALEKQISNKKSMKLKNIINKAIKLNKKVLFLGDFYIDVSFLGIKSYDLKSDFKLSYSKFKPFESKIIYHSTTNYLSNGEKLIIFKDSKGNENDLCVKTKWGGYYVNPFTYANFNNVTMWKVSPFKLLPYMLDLKPLPLPDFTTENGNRIWYSHIDGDGFVNRNDVTGKFAVEMLYKEIFTKYNLPISESVIIGEIAPFGIYPKDSKKAIKIIKKIFKLPNIEPATHTYSHPFDWRKNPIPHLSLKGYKFNYKTEITGSIKYLEKIINKKVNLLFWSGNCNPYDYEVKYAKDNNILNINSLDTFITYDNKYLFNIAPLGIYRGDYFQVSAQIANENIFTNGWQNKLGYLKAIQTLKLTENPRRLKPIDIYYHNYSGAFNMSIYALKKVIDYSIKQKIIPMFTSNFIKIALDYENSILLQTLDNKYIYKNSGDLRTLKIKGKKKINIKKSKGVIGYIYQKGYTYISLDNSNYHKIIFGKSNIPYLISANKRLIKKQKNIYIFEPKFGKLKTKFFIPKKCKKIVKKNKVEIKCMND